MHTCYSFYCATERDVFAALGLDYVRPQDRNISENFGNREGEEEDDADMQPFADSPRQFD